MLFRKVRPSTPTSLDMKGEEGHPRSRRPPKFEPAILKPWAILSHCGVMIGLAVGIEVALYFSKKKNGFEVPEDNVLSFNNFFSAQFLTSFFPTLLVVPLAYLWGVTWFWFRVYQPYVALSHGDAEAETSVTLNYLVTNKFKALFQAWKRRHRILFVTGIVSTFTILFQPLAGAIFEVKMKPSESLTRLESRRNVGLASDVNDLNAFSAAAGYAEAAVFHNLSDPPFIKGGWAVAEFGYPDDLPESAISLIVNTTAVQTQVGCANPEPNAVKLDTPASGDYTITSGLQHFGPGGGSCNATVKFNPQSADQQYGVEPVANCGGENDSRFQPVMFWYFHSTSGGKNAQARTVFCAPTIQVFNVEARVHVTNATLFNVTSYNRYVADNNVTGGDLNGRAFNGVIFPKGDNEFVNARAVAVRSAVPGAVFRFAAQSNGGAASVFDNDDGFFDLTTAVYTQHLSISAKSNYFVKAAETLDVTLWAQKPRLWIDPVSAHVLASLLALTGTLGLVLHISHRKARRSLYLTHEPGSLASSAVLTHRSGLGSRLSPWDTDAQLQEKLRGVHFSLDPSTGALVIDEGVAGEAYGRPISAYGSRTSMYGSSSPRTSRVGATEEGIRLLEVQQDDSRHESSLSLSSSDTKTPPEVTTTEVKSAEVPVLPYGTRHSPPRSSRLSEVTFGESFALDKRTTP